ncbi:DNA-binding transcriptional regulator, MocR family, contains an aminotransferase domain [Actinacidiphila yanglinensis]|uniref:DNA-binding transcriptional regulator, MocR family, contains an aminotransferase domain n=1 Tax=Actinacidiphila yanglinensis TaxID=310779 RepID=A0A1H5U1A3_9ACTN|nr:pyridoxal phosphate-dependent aminotransferase [Actinacidiphila yanglinensis]SEF68031.1 DNA-binding transcriptional regulator, MocR family, contains an aminotransferase domain [Actinacidiphila yanglinensis]
MIDLTGPLRPWSARLAERFARCLAGGARTRSWWRPPAPRGEPELLDRLAELFGSPPERTVVTGGVRQFATSWAVRTGPAAVEAPTFADIPQILGAGLPVRRVPWRELTGGAAGPPGTIWLTSPFRNPDGRSLTAGETEAVGRLAGQGHTVVVNQVYRWFHAAGPAPAAPDGAWTVTSFAKMAGGGLRLGWAVAPRPDAVPRTLTSDGPPTAWQRACAGFLDEATLRALRADCVEPTTEARQAFAARACELTGRGVPGGGLSAVFTCPGSSEAEAVELLARQGLEVSPGSAFGCPAPSVRLAFSGTTAAQAVRAAETMARLRPGFTPTSFP